MNKQNTVFNKFYPFIVGILASTFYIYDFTVRVLPAAITHDLMLSFNIFAPGLGLLSAIFFYGYAPMQIPGGMLYDKYGERAILTLTMAICALSTAAFALTDNFTLALVFRFISGFAAAFAYTGALYVGAHWFPRKHFALYAGLVQFLGCMGAIIGGAPIALLTKHYGWQNTTLMIAAAGIIFALLIGLVIRDSPKKQITPEKHLLHGGKRSAFRHVVKKPENWWIALFGFAIWAPVILFAVLWGVPFLMALHHVSKVHATSAMAIIWLGIAFIGPLLGWWSSHIKRRKLPMVLAASTGLVASILLIYFPHVPDVAIGVLLFLYGGATSAQVLSFGLAMDNNRSRVLGTAIGFTNMAVIASGVVLQPTVGFILQHFWDGARVNGVAVYSVHAYQIALLMIPVCFLLALIISSFLIKETYCQKV